jgi:hypothetical protein
MKVGDLVQLVGRVEEGPPEELAFRLSELGELVEAALADPGVLTYVSERVIEVARDLACEAVAGASAVGERMAGAAAALSGRTLRLCGSQNGHDGSVPARVLLLDGLFATGTQLSWLAQRLKTQGVESTPAAVVVSVTRNGIPPALNEVVTLT